jgi:hypothetical protein
MGEGDEEFSCSLNQAALDKNTNDESEEFVEYDDEERKEQYEYYYYTLLK